MSAVRHFRNPLCDSPPFAVEQLEAGPMGDALYRMWDNLKLTAQQLGQREREIPLLADTPQGREERRHAVAKVFHFALAPMLVSAALLKQLARMDLTRAECQATLALARIVERLERAASECLEDDEIETVR